jgi:hypothetical protein
MTLDMRGGLSGRLGRTAAGPAPGATGSDLRARFSRKVFMTWWSPTADEIGDARRCRSSNAALFLVPCEPVQSLAWEPCPEPRTGAMSSLYRFDRLVEAPGERLT